MSTNRSVVSRLGLQTQGPRLKGAMLYQLSYRLTRAKCVIQPGDCQPLKNPKRLPIQRTRNVVDGENTSADCASVTFSVRLDPVEIMSIRQSASSSMRAR